jgi:hypothetical protein
LVQSQRCRHLSFANPPALESHKNSAVIYDSIGVLEPAPFPDRWLLRHEELAQSYQAQSVRTAILSQIERADQLEWPIRQRQFVMICVRYRDTEQKYNEYTVPAISADQRSASSIQMDAPIADEMRRISRKIIVVLKYPAASSRCYGRPPALFVPLHFRTPLISVIVRTFWQLRSTSTRLGGRSGWRESGGS